MLGNVKLLGLLLTVVVSATGCVTPDYGDTIGSFQKSIDTATVSVGTYLTALNQYERKLYLESRLVSDKLELLWTDTTGKPTALRGKVFGAKSIKARMDALRLIGAYARRLAELAGSDAPTRFATGATELGTNLDKLASTFRSLQQEGNDATASGYFEPIGQLLAVTGEMILAAKRDAAVTKAIQDGARESVAVPFHRRTGRCQKIRTSISQMNVAKAWHFAFPAEVFVPRSFISVRCVA